MADTLKLEIVTPEEKIYSEDVNMITLPGTEGELGVYPNHVPVLTAIKPGELRIVKDGRESAMAVGEGFVEIKGDAVSILTDMALQSEKIDIFFLQLAGNRGEDRFCVALLQFREHDQRFNVGPEIEKVLRRDLSGHDRAVYAVSAKELQ